MFDTTLLSIDCQDMQIGIEFSTLEEYNNSSSAQELCCHRIIRSLLYVVMESPICISKEDERIYLWIVRKESLLIFGILFMIFSQMKLILH